MENQGKKNPLLEKGLDPAWLTAFSGRLIRRFLLLAGLWLVLTGGGADSWLPGLPAAILALLASFALPASPPWRFRLAGLCRFLPFFLWHSLQAAIDVARRAFHPDLPLAPGLIEYRWRLTSEPARVFFANSVSLLPGTMSVGFGPDKLTVHALDVRQPHQAGLRRLEARVAALFAQETLSLMR